MHEYDQAIDTVSIVFFNLDLGIRVFLRYPGSEGRTDSNLGRSTAGGKAGRGTRGPTGDYMRSCVRRGM